MDRRTKYGVLLLVILIAGLSLYGIFSQLYGSNKTLARADVSITAPGLASSFEGDEKFADSLYLYKVISVTGVLQQLIRDGSGNLIVRLAGDRTGKSMVDCHLDSLYRREDLRLRAGDSITLRGTCAGQWVNIILLQCIVEK